MVLGDFNSSTQEVGATLEGAGLHRVVGGFSRSANVMFGLERDSRAGGLAVAGEILNSSQE